jgi:hypothetical protein
MSFARVLVVWIIAALALVSAGCSGEPPNNEIEQARSAVEAARAAEADRYATQEFAAAEDALKRAHEAVDQRDYRLALNNALDSRDRAQQAAKTAAAGKAAARAEADRAVAAAAAAVKRTQATLKSVEAGRPPARIVSAARQAIGDAELRMQEARTAVEKGDYADATKTANAVTQAMTAAASDLAGANTGALRRRR